MHTNEQQPNHIIAHQWEGQRFLFSCDNQTSLQLVVISDEIIRFRYAPEGVFLPDHSYAIDDTHTWPKAQPLLFQEAETFYEIKTAKLNCTIFKKHLRVCLKNKAGKVLLEDHQGFHWSENDAHGGYYVKMSKKSQPHECYYGLGDKAHRLNLRGNKFENWCKDAFAYEYGTDPLYKTIPFYYGQNANGCYGLFFDNSHHSFFDFAHDRIDTCSFWALGGEMNYYFIYGEALLDISRKYTLLTGRPEMPPLWALGFHQCKWSYYPEEEVMRIAQTMRELKIPCDALYLDIDYMDGYRCFTWDKEKFPNPARMIANLKDQGFKTIVMIDPGIKIDPNYWIYQEGIKNDYFIKRPDGDLLKGSVWPGPCHFPDYTHPEVRKWWAGLYRDLIREDGVSGFWNDMNEPAVFNRHEKTIHTDGRHHYEGLQASHRKAHNVYGMQMAKASYEGIKQWNYPKRPFLITRAMYAGTQRYALAWTGDNMATWAHLKLANTQCQRLSISGVSFIGTDIGGFDGVPSGELFTRWLQLATFHPFFRVHSIGDHLSGALPVDTAAIEEKKKANQNITDQEPWSFGEPYTSIIRQFVELRYQLLPYIYTAFWQYVAKGTPMLRPLSFLASDDHQTHYREDEFGLGDSLLICPVVSEGSKARTLYLPKGQWYHYWNDECYQGNKEIRIETPLSQIPIFVKAGSIVPFYPVMPYVGAEAIQLVTLHLYYKKEETTSVWYEDEGEGYDYEEGKCVLKTLILKGSEKEVVIEQRKEGFYKGTYATYRLVLHGFPFEAGQAILQPTGKSLFIKDDGSILVDANFSILVIK